MQKENPMVENCDRILPVMNHRKFLSRFRIVLVPFQKGCFFTGMVFVIFSGSLVIPRKIIDTANTSPVIRNKRLKSYLSETVLRMIPASTEPRLMNPLAAAD